MEDEAKSLIDEVRQMREQYQTEVGTAGRKAWPRSIKERVMRLDKMSLGTKRVAELTGVPYETILQWRYTAKHHGKKQFHALAVVDSKQTATVTVPALQAESVLNNATVTVAAANGLKIEGPLDLVLSMLKRISGGS